MAYPFTVNGVNGTANYDPYNYVPPPGTKYQIDVNLIVPVSQLFADLAQLAADIAGAIAGATGATLTNIAISTPDASTVRFVFTASSPVIVAALAPWIGPIIIAALIAFIAVVLFPPSSGGVPAVANAPVAILLGIAAVAGVGILAYGFIKSKEVREETFKTTAAGIRYGREVAAPSLGRAAAGAASFARKGVASASRFLRPESEEP